MVQPLNQTAGFTPMSPSVVQQDTTVVQTPEIAPKLDETPTASIPPQEPPQFASPDVLDNFRGKAAASDSAEAAKAAAKVDPAPSSIPIEASNLQPQQPEPMSFDVPDFSSVLDGLTQEDEPDFQVQEANVSLDAHAEIKAEESGDYASVLGRISSAPLRGSIDVVKDPTKRRDPDAGQLTASSGILNFDRAKGVNSGLLKVVENARQFLPEGVQMSVGFQGGTRTLEEQKALLAKGVTKTLKSRHIGGRAIDIHPVINGKNKFDSNDTNDWAAVRDAMKKSAAQLGVKVEWGGDWKNAWDKSHWQLS